MTDSYSIRKIPVVYKENIDSENIDSIDKIKILEISNFIDKWEQEILFSENGFYSLKGKNVENKTKEFIQELNELVNSKIFEINFSDSMYKEIISDIKNKKIAAIKKQMSQEEYESLANTVVYNNNSVEVLEEKVCELIELF